MQATLVRTALLSADTATGVFFLDHLIRRGVTGDPQAQTAWLGAALFLVDAMDDPAVYPRLSRWYELAAEEGRTHVGNVLLEAPPYRSVADPRALQLGRLGKDVTLGERRQLASGRDRKMLAQLLADLTPAVVRKLIQNPRIEMADVLSIATRRPNIADTLQEVARSHRWVAQYDVRVALVNNPYIRTGTALKLLALLRGPDLRQVAFAGDLHPCMAKAAECLLDIRGTKNLK
jgi:hypothetical protein